MQVFAAFRNVATSNEIITIIISTVTLLPSSVLSKKGKEEEGGGDRNWQTERKLNDDDRSLDRYIGSILDPGRVPATVLVGR